jgi:mRNA interferase RelE/StbE
VSNPLWKVIFDLRAEKEFFKLDSLAQKRIRQFIEGKLQRLTNPRQIGHPLTGTLSHFWRYRVGDYRLLCSIKDNELTILVVHVGHRREIYH